MGDYGRLTEKQRAFVEAYMGEAEGNATRAAELAGYQGGENTLSSVGSENLRKAEILAAIEERREQIRAQNQLPISAALKSKLIEELGGIQEAVKAVRRVVESLLDERSLDSLTRRSVSDETRYGVLHRAGFKCQACGASPEPTNDVELEVDHIKPISRGGGNDADNLQCLCARCNASKGNRFTYDHNSDLNDG